MRITKNQLKQIIKEELAGVLGEGDDWSSIEAGIADTQASLAAENTPEGQRKTSARISARSLSNEELGELMSGKYGKNPTLAAELESRISAERESERAGGGTRGHGPMQKLARNIAIHAATERFIPDLSPIGRGTATAVPGPKLDVKHEPLWPIVHPDLIGRDDETQIAPTPRGTEIKESRRRKVRKTRRK